MSTTIPQTQKIKHYVSIRMGQDLSIALIPPPLTLQDCIINGRFDITRYLYFRRTLDHYEDVDHIISNNASRKRRISIKMENQRKKARAPRSVKRHKVLVRENDGSLREILPTDTLWYLLYVAHPPQNKRLSDKFRLRFRLPYDVFLELSEEIKHHELFQQWTRCDAVGNHPSDMKLLLLGSLRYIGRSWTLDDICEANGISINTNDSFLKAFIKYGSTTLYKKWVLDQRITNPVHEQESIFRLAGFNGCIGSTDATHVAMLQCPFWAHNIHKGFKLNTPARTYNVTADHSRRIIGSTSGHPGTWNDKTLVLFDELLYNIREKNIFKDFEFKLFERDANDKIIEVTYEGVWLMVDNGYLAWSCTVPPDSNATAYEGIRFSEWLESMRKDVECLFGIMKGRFCILRNGFKFHKIEHCDQLWLTCCALHNMLLNVDGLDKNWENGIRSNWEIHDNRNRNQNFELIIDTPFALTRLNRDVTFEDVESSDDDSCNVLPMETLCRRYTINGKRIVANMPLHLFRKCLISHFNIRFERNDIIWPRCLKKVN